MTTIEILKNISLKAGEAIMQVYNSGDFLVEAKANNSPLTIADKKSHKIITEELKKQFPDIPIISEEDLTLIAYETRKKWTRFWLVDPLDGTKNFINKEQDFTTNIGLIENGKPVLGVVYAPAIDCLYIGDTRSNIAQKEINGTKISIKAVRKQTDKIIAVRSKNHQEAIEEDILSHFSVCGTATMGSSLKFCLVAEGKADIYFRGGPTWEWDTAAAHAIVIAAGAKVYSPNWQTKEPLLYNKKSLRNFGGFMCVNKRMDKMI